MQRQERSQEQRRPVTVRVHGPERITGAGQATAGAVGEESLLAVVTLQPGVANQAGTLARALVTIIWVHDPFAAAAAVATLLWQGDKTQEMKNTPFTFSSNDILPKVLPEAQRISLTLKQECLVGGG